MEKILVFIDQPDELQDLKLINVDSSKTETFSFDIRTHYFLEEKKIKHQIGEKILSQNDSFEIFDKAVSLWNWYEKGINFNNENIDGINLFEILDTAEFHNLIIKEIYILLTMNRILDFKKPRKLYVNEHFGNALKEKCIKENIELCIIAGTKHEFITSWENPILELKLSNLSISLPISRSLIRKTKSTIDKFQDKFQKLSLETNETRKILLFLEINPKTYETIFNNLDSNKKQIVILNRRRPIIDSDSLKIISKNKIKLINSNNFLDKNDRNLILKTQTKFLKNLNFVWSNNQKTLKKIFSIENISFWILITDVLFKIIKKRIHEYAELIILSKKIHSTLNINCIIHHNYVGETEKVILNTKYEKSTSIMLQHAYANYSSEFMRYDVFDTSHFKDKIALWGEKQKTNLLKHKEITSDKIILSGSPRHDIFFNSKPFQKKSSKKTVLITTQNFEWTNALLNTNQFINVESIFQKIFDIFDDRPEIELKLKLHPARDPYNEFLKDRIKKMNTKIQILQSESSKSVIEDCDLLVNIHSELIPSTTMLEGLILQKPILNITLLQNKKFDYDDFGAVHTIFHTDLDKQDFDKLLFNSKSMDKLLQNGQKYVQYFLANPGVSSIYFSNLLNDL